MVPEAGDRRKPPRPFGARPCRRGRGGKTGRIWEDLQNYHTGTAWHRRARVTKSATRNDHATLAMLARRQICPNPDTPQGHYRLPQIPPDRASSIAHLSGAKAEPCLNRETNLSGMEPGNTIRTASSPNGNWCIRRAHRPINSVCVDHKSAIHGTQLEATTTRFLHNSRPLGITIWTNYPTKRRWHWSAHGMVCDQNARVRVPSSLQSKCGAALSP